MKRIKTFYIVIIVLFTILFVGAVGSLGIYTTRTILRKDAAENLSLMCENKCLEFNATLSSIEQSVDTISSAAVYHLDDLDTFRTSREYVDNYTAKLEHLLLYAAENTTGAMSIYLRYNPELADSDTGLFYVLNKSTGEYESVEVTDFSTASSEDTTWYYIPAENGVPTWMDPYENNNIGYRMISYVVPYYVDDTLIGIIGMDIDYDYIEEMVYDISIYDTGFAFLLTKDGQIAIHPNFDWYENVSSHIGTDEFLPSDIPELSESQSVYSNSEKTILCQTLDNGMILALSTPTEEIYQDASLLTGRIIAIAATALIIVTIMASVIVRSTFHLSEIDTLTGIHNRKYFIDIYQSIDSEKLKDYCLFLFDIDKFKQINDTYGHNNGDLAIQFVAHTAAEILGKKSYLARWGGDEFIGLLPKDTAKESLEKLRQYIADAENETYRSLSISIGATPTMGKPLTEVTEQADAALYQSKSAGRNRLTMIE